MIVAGWAQWVERGGEVAIVLQFVHSIIMSLSPPRATTMDTRLAHMPDGLDKEYGVHDGHAGGHLPYLP